MSADNGIYILKMADQSRVIHAMAIENLYWSLETMQETNALVSTRIVEYYDSVPFMTHKEAQKKAFEMEEEILSDDYCSILEYGISTIQTSKTWNEIYQEAKIVVEKEIEYVKNHKPEIWLDGLLKLKLLLNA